VAAMMMPKYHQDIGSIMARIDTNAHVRQRCGFSNGYTWI